MTPAQTWVWVALLALTVAGIPVLSYACLAGVTPA